MSKIHFKAGQWVIGEKNQIHLVVRSATETTPPGIAAGVQDLENPEHYRVATVEEVKVAGGSVYATLVTTGKYGSARVAADGTAIAGDFGTAKVGELGKAIAGYKGVAIAGFQGTAMVGDCGTAEAGDIGTAVAGLGGTAMAGDQGVIMITRLDGTGTRRCIGIIGQNGLKPRVPYHLNGYGEFEEGSAVVE